MHPFREYLQQRGTTMLPPRPSGMIALAADTDTGGALARLTALEGLSRAVLVGIIPLIAFAALGSKEAVAQTYLIAAIITLFITLNFSRLEKLLQRRWVLTLGGVLLILSSLLIYKGNDWGFAIGVGLRSAAASIFTVCISLYVMDYIQKPEFARTESRRMLYNGVAWLLGPLIGIWLWDHGYQLGAFLVSILAATAMLAYFWHLRLGDNPVLVAAKPRKPIHPLTLLPHFFKQKFLRISYLITLSRAIFWVLLYIYGPIYVVEAGLPNWVGAVLLSAGCAMLFFSHWVRALAERFHTKNVLIFGLCLCGGSLLMLGVLGEAQKFGLLFWWTGAWGASMVDVLGNIPFMRTVKPYERTEMTMVFSTWREMSELVTPLIIAIILIMLPFSTVYYVFGGFLLLIAVYARELPNRV